MGFSKGVNRAGGLLFLCLALLLVAMGCNGDDRSTGNGSGSASAASSQQGEELFNANCTACHGGGAAGTDLGPPLVHRLYHPGHHPDFSIRNAVAQGVVQHHWPFGNMAPVAGLSSDDVENIICYIRETQRAGGVFSGDDFGTVC